MIKGIGKLVVITLVIMIMIFGIKKVSKKYNIPVLSTVSQEV